MAHLVLTLAFAAVASATNLFVSSYEGDVTSLSLTEKNGDYQLKKLATNPGCAPSPSWLTLDADNGVLYCLDEGLTTPNGSLSSYLIQTDGSLKQVERQATISGPVSGIIYPPGSTDKRGIALAHYEGSAVSSWTLGGNGTGSFKNNEDLYYTLAHPGPNAARQDAPHEHEAILDPTGQYVIVPDLGADLVRVFSYNKDLQLVAHKPLSVTPGSGPRHAAFYNPYEVCDNCVTFMYVVTELGNTVTGYNVTYLPDGAGLTFDRVYRSSVYGPKKLPEGNAAAEIHISPDMRFVTISNRNNTSFEIPNPNPKNSTKIPSDSLSTFKLNHDGTLDFLQLWPAGGLYPRQYSMNTKGDLVAVGLQYSAEVVILSRNISSGLIGNAVARIDVPGNVTCVVWDEQATSGMLAM